MIYEVIETKDRITVNLAVNLGVKAQAKKVRV